MCHQALQNTLSRQGCFASKENYNLVRAVADNVKNDGSYFAALGESLLLVSALSVQNIGDGDGVVALCFRIFLTQKNQGVM